MLEIEVEIIEINANIPSSCYSIKGHSNECDASKQDLHGGLLFDKPRLEDEDSTLPKKVNCFEGLLIDTCRSRQNYTN